MAKNAKRRGRPPGSKNKPRKVAGNKIAKMEVGQLKAYIDDLQSILAAKVTQQKEYLESQLEGLQIYAGNKAGAAVRAVMRLPSPRKRKRAEPKYQSKKNKSLKWSGRGMLPTWMRDEIKGTKLTKEDFAIKS